MNIISLLGRRRDKALPETRAYEAIVAAARHPAFYESGGVADTPEGRFDMIVLHMFLALERLREMPDLAQALVDTMFRDMDGALREMGASDPAVPKKVRRLEEAYFGRVTAYRRALEQDGPGLEDALRRNVFAGGPGDAAKLARYVRRARDALSQEQAAPVARGEIVFPDPEP